jgi:hypothetical protein
MQMEIERRTHMETVKSEMRRQVERKEREKKTPTYSLNTIL